MSIARYALAAAFTCFMVLSASATHVEPLQGGAGQDGWKCYCGPDNGPFGGPGETWTWSLAPTDRVSALGQCQSLCGDKAPRLVPQVETRWHLSMYQFRDFNRLGTYVFSDFTPEPENPEEPLNPPVFDPTQLDSGLQAGIGATLRLRGWLALDIGLTAGSGRVARESRSPRAREEAHVRLLGGSINAKMYPLQSTVARVQPWLSTGVRGLTLRPTSGSYTTYGSRGQRYDLPSQRFRSASGADFATGAGADCRVTDRLGVNFSGEYGFRTGWRAGASLTFAISSPTAWRAPRN